MKGKLIKIQDLGFQVNRFQSNELVDQCILIFEGERGEHITYNLSKSYSGNAKLGKFIKALKGSSVSKEELDEDNLYDMSELLGKEANILLDDNQKVVSVVPLESGVAEV